MYTPIVIMTVISSEGEAGLSLGLWRRSRSPCYLCLKKTLLRRRRPFDNEAFRAPNQRLESSFCRRTAGQRLP